MPRKAKISKKTKDGSTLTAELDDNEAKKYLDEDEPDEDSEELFSPVDEVSEVEAALGGNVSLSEYHLHRYNPENSELSFVQSLTGEQAKNPQFIKQTWGGGKYQLKILQNGQVLKTLTLNIDGSPRPSPAPMSSLLPATVSGDNTVLLMIMESNKTNIEVMRAQMEIQKEEIRAAAARADKMMEMFMQALIHRPKDDTPLDMIVKVAGVFKNTDSSGQALESMLSFMSKMGETVANLVGGGSDNPLMMIISQFKGPLIEFLNSRRNAQAGSGALVPYNPQQAPPAQAQAPPGTAPAPGSGNGQAGPGVTPAQILQTFEQNILPYLLTASREKNADGSPKWDPVSFADTLRFQFQEYGDLKQILSAMVGTKEALFLRYPIIQNEAAWFSDLWDALLEIEPPEEEPLLQFPQE